MTSIARGEWQMPFYVSIRSKWSSNQSIRLPKYFDCANMLQLRITIHFILFTSITFWRIMNNVNNKRMRINLFYCLYPRLTKTFVYDSIARLIPTVLRIWPVPEALIITLFLFSAKNIPIVSKLNIMYIFNVIKLVSDILNVYLKGLNVFYARSWKCCIAYIFERKNQTVSKLPKNPLKNPYGRIASKLTEQGTIGRR